MIIIAFSVLFFVLGFMFGAKYICERLDDNTSHVFKKEPSVSKKREIKEHFTDTGDSFSDLMCEVTGEQTDTYIKQNRLKQNDAYTYVKNR